MKIAVNGFLETPSVYYDRFSRVDFWITLRLYSIALPSSRNGQKNSGNSVKLFQKDTPELNGLSLALQGNVAARKRLARLPYCVVVAIRHTAAHGGLAVLQNGIAVNDVRDG